MLACEACGHENKEGSKFCRACGKTLAPVAAVPNRVAAEDVPCRNCGTLLAGGARFCKKCGAAVVKEVPAAATPEPAAAPASSEPASPAVAPPEPLPPAPAAEPGPESDLAVQPASAAALEPPALAGSEPVLTAAAAVARIRPPPPRAMKPNGTPCAKCSAALMPGAKFCITCGTTVQAEQALAVEEARGEPPDDTALPSKRGAKPMLIAGVAAGMVAVVVGVGFFVWHSSKQGGADATPAGTDTAAAPVPAAQPAPVPVQQVAPAAPAVPVATQENTPAAPAVAAAPAVQAPAVATPAAEVVAPQATPAQSPPPAPPQPAEYVTRPARPVPSQPMTAPAAPATPPGYAAAPSTKGPDPMTQKVAALLSKADGYISSQQFDKAIATAESVLELDPGNTNAAATIRRAKAKQMELLKSGSTVE